MTAKKCGALLLLACAVGLLAWRLWPDSAQARRQQRDRDLIQAVIHNDLPAATRLLGEGADPSGHLRPLTISQKAQFYFTYAARYRRVPPWGDRNGMDERWSLLEMAALRGNGDMVRALLAKGADVGYRDGGGNTALTLAEKWDGYSRNKGSYSPIIALLKAAAAPSLPPVSKP